ncbi:Lysophospholipid acyltransferase [Myxococcus hansupus]|uniref:Lysophospholipid acyltransferase n=1 Tax=Pseudomyxococcus hansupus TaxID=1297742 RepID=A0A0H4XL87_9BACT|nr:acyltransferase [Myxococcus hansupus]AKQ69007.1 Lysophospholipid acyltransferase [Myxococcus hansupus]
MSSRRSLDALTGLRFFAALHVVLFHFAAPTLGSAPEVLRNWVGAGYAAVGVFFVLSGFVLAWNYLDADGRMETPPRAFWAARVARVYPVYVLAFLLSAPTTIAASVETNGWAMAAAKLAVGGLAALTLLQAWLPRLALYWNPPGWSVAVEACFYGVFPWLSRGLSRLRPSWLPGALGVTWVLGLAPPLLYLALTPDGPGPVDAASSGTWLTALKVNPLARLPEFLFGVLLGWAFVRERAAGGAGRSGAVLAALGTALLVVAGAAGSRIAYPLMHNALLAPASGLLVYGLARGGGALGWLLSRPLCVKLGGASFALYLLQYPVSEAAKGLGDVLSPWVELRTPEGLLGLVLLLGVPASLWVHRAVETPLRARVRAALTPWVEGASQAPTKPFVSGV